MKHTPAERTSARTSSRHPRKIITDILATFRGDGLLTLAQAAELAGVGRFPPAEAASYFVNTPGGWPTVKTSDGPRIPMKGLRAWWLRFHGEALKGGEA